MSINKVFVIALCAIASVVAIREAFQIEPIAAAGLIILLSFIWIKYIKSVHNKTKNKR